MKGIFDKEMVIVEANAGTGKTTLIVDKYVDLLLKGYSPENIVLITFTEAAASEVRDRVKNKIYSLLVKGEDSLQDALIYLPSAPIGTIHSFCFNILKTYGFRYRFFDIDSKLLSDVEVEELLDFAVFNAIGSTNPAMLSEVFKHISVDYIDAFNVVVRFIKETIKHRTRYLPIFKGFDVDLMVNSIFSKFCKLSECELSEKGKGNLEKEKLLIKGIVDLLREAFSIYEDEKIKRLRVGYNDLLEKTLEFLRNFDNAKEEIVSDLRFIMVDEFQDTDPIQWEIIKELTRTKTPPGLFLVGDPKQSIYRFRSADISIWKDAKSFVKNCFPLVKNYRSKKELLSFFNKLFSRVYDGEKRLGIEVGFNRFLEEGEEGGNVYFIDFETFDEFARKTVPIVIERANKEKVGIIGRTRKDLAVFEKVLRELGVDFSVLSSNPFDTYGVREVMHLLKFIADSENSKEKFFVLTSRFVGLSHSEAINCINREETCPDGVKEFLSLIDNFRKLKDTQLHSVFINRLLDETGYYDMLYMVDKESYFSLLEFVNEIARFESENFIGFEELIGYLESLISSRDRTLSMKTDFKKGILLTTIHGSKGLEFETVVAIPWRKGGGGRRYLFTNLGIAIRLFSEDKKDFNDSPLFNALSEINSYLDFQEEKNLLYVCFTRAMDNLILGLRKVKGDLEFPYGNFDFKAKPSTFDAERVIEVFRDEEKLIPLKYTPSEFLRTLYPSSHQKVTTTEKNPFLPEGMDPRDYGNAVHALCEAFIRGGEKEESVAYAVNKLYSPGKDLIRRLKSIYDLLGSNYRFLIGADVEVPFTYLRGKEVIRGRIDLLLKTERGYEIWDIKTGLFNRELFNVYSEQLKLYRDAFEKAGYKISSLKLFYIDENRVIPVSSGGEHKSKGGTS
jgi:ATP-dependent exoDNAse (exonuclease V) beta subunit